MRKYSCTAEPNRSLLLWSLWCIFLGCHCSPGSSGSVLREQSGDGERPREFLRAPVSVLQLRESLLSAHRICRVRQKEGADGPVCESTNQSVFVRLHAVQCCMNSVVGEKSAVAHWKYSKRLATRVKISEHLVIHEKSNQNTKYSFCYLRNQCLCRFSILQLY